MAAADITEEQFEKLNSILGAVNSGMMSNYKSQQAEDLATKHLVKSIMRLSGETEQEATRLAKQIKAEDEAARKAEQREKTIVEGFKKTLHGLQQFAGGAISASQSAYNSDSAFTAVIPTVQLLGDTVKNITSALASFTSGIPFFGAIFGGIDKVAAAGIDITTKIISSQLENSQRMLDIFNDITKTGMTFGGDLKHMTEVALSTGMDLKSFGKFVTGNIQSLAAMGGSVELSAIRIATMSKRVADSNKGLLAVYGSYDAMASATADFAATLTAAGLDTRNDSVMNEAAVKQYLIAQKELTAITGKTREVAKKELDDKLRQAAYQTAFNNLDKEGRLNVQRNTAVFSMFGKEAEKVADEYFATSNLYSADAARFQSQFPVLTEAIKKLTEDAKTMSAEQFNKTQGEYLKSVAPLLQQEKDKFQRLYGLAYSVKGNAFIDMLSTTGAGIGAMLPKINDLGAAIASQAQDTQNMNSSQSQVIGGVIESMSEFKRKMDSLTAGSIDKMANLTKTLFSINEQLAAAFGTPAMLNKLATDFSKLINDILKELNKDRSGGTTETSPGGNNNNPMGDVQTNFGAALDNNTTAVNTNTEVIRGNTSSLGQWFTDLMRRNEEGRPGGAPVSGTLTPAVQPTPALAPAPAPAPTGTTTPQKLRAPVKPGQGVEKVTPETVAALNAVYDYLGEKYGMQVTAGIDEFHKNKKGSLHPTGRAADIKFRKSGADYDTIQKQVNQMFKDKGIDAKVEVHRDETNPGNQVLELSTPKKSTGEKRSAVDIDQNTQIALEERKIELQERTLAVLEESRDTLDVLKRQLAV